MTAKQAMARTERVRKGKTRPGAPRTVDASHADHAGSAAAAPHVALASRAPRQTERRVQRQAERRATILAAALEELRRSEEMTAANPGMLLRLALSYGGRTEIADALKRVAEDAKSGRLDPAEIDEETLRAYLYDPATPDPDLLIRTAGEMRISNYLLWQISYSEFWVTPKCWLEFDRSLLFQSFRDYASRVRRSVRRVSADAAGAEDPGDQALS